MNKKQISTRVFSFLAVGAALSTAAGCAPKSQNQDVVSDKNFVQAGKQSVDAFIGDDTRQFHIISADVLEKKVTQNKEYSVASSSAAQMLEPLVSAGRGGPSILKGPKFKKTKVKKGRRNPRLTDSGEEDLEDILDPEDNEPVQPLIFGMPLKMFNKSMEFGSAVTQVSDGKSEDLGRLKLANLPPFHVMAVVYKDQKDENSPYFFVLLSCGADCKDVSKLEPFFKLPIESIDAEKEMVYVNLALLGKGLDLAAIRKGDPALEGFKSKSSRAVRFDYSLSTLVFDVEARLVKKDLTGADPQSPEIVITNRWFLRDAADLNPAFVTRKETKGVGFFTTMRKDSPTLIERWDFDHRKADEGIKYYIKNVPLEFQGHFKAAFEEWNEKLLPVLGKKVFSYEFISVDDPRSKLLTAGDVRYNIMEWDLDNKAPYGGLGPSLSHQFSGEIFNANVLVQGPTVVELYQRWFKTSRDANELRHLGRNAEADALLAEANREIQTQVEKSNQRTFKLKVGKNLEMNVVSQDPRFQDPLLNKEGFDLIPEGYSFDTYIPGYFKDMLAHELGHNLGLRHNFKGNLGATHGKPTEGNVSRSVMEYLGRGFRHLDHIGEYDLMAIAYGYNGVMPTHLDWFCTDEDAADVKDPTKSAECSSADATDDPFSYFEKRLDRAVELLVARGKTTAPDWTVTDMKDQLEAAIVGLGAYAASAMETSSTWTNFFNGGNRPTEAYEVKPYVLSKFKAVLCDPALADEVKGKESPEASEKALANVKELRAKAKEILKPVYSVDELACTQRTHLARRPAFRPAWR